MKKNKKNLLLGLIFCLSFYLLVSSFSIAKYVVSFVWDYYLETKGFYLSSNQLNKQGIQNVDNSWDGDKVYFNLKNSLNKEVITSYDIEYQVSCTVKDSATSSCHLNGTDYSSLTRTLASIQNCVNNTEDEVDVSSYEQTECELGGYDWVSQVASKDLYFEIIPNSQEFEVDEVEVEIEVTSTKPYKKTLKGTFILHKSDTLEDMITMDYQEYSEYSKLIVSNSYLEEKEVKITWDPTKLMIDDYDEELVTLVIDNNEIKGIEFEIGSKESKGFIFYKKDLETIIKVDDFIIELEND